MLSSKVTVMHAITSTSNLLQLDSMGFLRDSVWVMGTLLSCPSLKVGCTFPVDTHLPPQGPNWVE